MNVVLLGSSGQIGKAILDKLIRIKKLKIICVGRQNQTKLLPKNVAYFQWDFVSFKDSKVKFLNDANIIVNCIGKNFNKANNLNYINFLFIKYLLRYISKKKLNLRLINLSSISVYGANQKYLFKDICVNESFLEAPYDAYSNSKYKSDYLIKKNTLHNKNNFTYTIFRTSNVIGTDRNSNLFKVIFFLLKLGIWIKSSCKTKYNFIHVNDVAQAIILCIKKLKITKNKIYILANDEYQEKLYKIFSLNNKKNFIVIPFSIKLIKLIYNFIPLPRIVANFFLAISSEISYSNNKLKKELGFKPKYFLKNKLL